MLRPSAILLLLILSVLSSVAHSVSLTPPTVLGSAYDREKGHLLYTEHHFCTQQGLQCEVEYRDSSGVLIAQKSLDYSGSPFSPALTMIDYRNKVKHSVPGTGQGDIVVDAGFDNYVRSIWDELEGGNSVRFPFLVPGFSRPLKMRADREMSRGCGQDSLCLEIRLDSWLLGMLASPIELAYSREERRLLRFSGVSNIKGGNGETLNVDIHYSYGDKLLLVGPLHYQKSAFHM